MQCSAIVITYYIIIIIFLQYLSRLEERLFDVSLYELWSTEADLMAFAVDINNPNIVGNFPESLCVLHVVLYFAYFHFVQHFHV